MYWEDSKDNVNNHAIPDEIVDLVFAISCRTLPVDHAFALSQSLKHALPWIADEPDVGVHTIHVAASGNGWMRPDSADQVLYPSRRTKLTLRVPKSRVEDARGLSGRTLDINGHVLNVGEAVVKSLSPITTVFARYVVCDVSQSETVFMRSVAEQLSGLDIKPKKMLCGVQKKLATAGDAISTRSLMLAELEFKETIILQQKGIGRHRSMGCGIFIPHKDIAEVSD